MITLALDRYDRHIPFFDSTVRLPSQLKDLKVLQVGQHGSLRDGAARHERMLRDREFDAAETSLASYIIAKSRGLPFSAIPIFPRRLFSQGQIFVNAASGIENPLDLEGHTIGLQSFQTTLAVLARGDLAREFGVSMEKINWKVGSPDAIEIGSQTDINITLIPAGRNLPDMLCDGQIDALFYSRLPEVSPERAHQFHRLFKNPKEVEADYVARNGYWPIMHVVALKDEAIATHPELPTALFELFAAADMVAETYLADPNWTRLAWTKYTAEEEMTAFGGSLWTRGVSANRANLSRFISYAFEQGLINTRMEVDELFHPAVRDS